MNSPTSGLHEYESWLDTLDKRLFVESGAVKVEFDYPLEVLLQECFELAGIKLQAARLRSALARNHTHLPREYLIERFIRLVIEANKLPLKRDDVMRELRVEWGIEDGFTDF